MNRKIFLLTVFFFTVLIRVSSQEISWKNRIYAEAMFDYGFLLPHSDFISFFVEEHIRGFQINVGLQTDGSKSWHQSYNFPRLGLGYHRSGLSNNNVYGEMNAFYAYVDRYYLKWNHNFNFGNKLSLGAAFINKKFDLENNSTNLAIGSNVNAYVNYSLETLYRVFPKTEIKLGGGITHVSNGNFKQPNKGLNFFSAFAGITYTLNTPTADVISEINKNKFKQQFLVVASYGRKQISRKYDYNFSVLAISGEYAHVIKGNSWGGVALTFYHDPSLEKELSLEDTIQTKFSDRIRVAVNLSYELKMGRISYVFQPGFYLRNPYKAPGNITNRLTFRYQVNKHICAGMTIKAHWFAIADFFEWGIGYKWNK